jgi:two-component sensor histidine kinase
MIDTRGHVHSYSNSSDTVRLLVDEISHRVMNEYARAISLLEVAITRTQCLEAGQVLAEVATALYRSAEFHRALRPPSSAMPIDLGEHLESICGHLCKCMLTPKGTRLLFVRQYALVSPSTCWRIGLIISELITNAAKHGLPDGSGNVVVEMIIGVQRVACRVSDDGICGVTPTVGRGRQIVNSLASEMGGSAEWCLSPNGNSIYLQIPN